MNNPSSMITTLSWNYQARTVTRIIFPYELFQRAWIAVVDPSENTDDTVASRSRDWQCGIGELWLPLPQGRWLTFPSASIYLRIRRFSYRCPDFFDTTGVSGVCPETIPRKSERAVHGAVSVQPSDVKSIDIYAWSGMEYGCIRLWRGWV